jgi:solute carrier family 45 protein 1/2/4
MTAFTSLPITEEGHDDRQQKFRGVSRILGPRWAQFPTITIGLLGVQIFWSLETAYSAFLSFGDLDACLTLETVSPYLLSLGMSKSSMASVFVAEPLLGLIIQPLIGLLADNSTSQFGRRRPYMLVGTVICTGALLLFGFTRPVASIFTGWDNDTVSRLYYTLDIVDVI